MAIQLAAAYLSLIPSLKGATRQIQSDLASVNVSTVGKGIAKNLSSAATSATDLAKAGLDKANHQLAIAERDLGAALRGRIDASGRAAIAQARLNELQASGAASGSSVLRATEQLRKARQDEALAAANVITAEAGVRVAKESVVAATNQLSEATAKASTFGARFANALPAVQAGLAGTGKSAVDLGGRLTQSITKPAIKAGAALAGITIGAGMQRLVAIDNARAKLSGLGNSAEAVESIMKNAHASVKGTAFGMGEAATTAASMVASGIKPGRQLEGVLKTVADTATIAGTSMSDMGAIFGSVAARGKLQGDDMLQLSTRGVPVLEFLAKKLGTTSAAVSDMVSQGKIDFATFASAMQENLGGAALNSGNTFTGALKNMWAAFGRVGANLLTGIFPQIKGIFGEVTAGLSGWEDKAEVWGQSLGRIFADLVERLRAVVRFWVGLPGPIKATAAASAIFMIALGPLLTGLGRLLIFSANVVGALNSLRPVLGAIGPLLGGVSLPLVGVVAGAAAAAGALWAFFTKTEAGQAILSRVGQAFKDFGAFISTAWALIVGSFTGQGADVDLGEVGNVLINIGARLRTGYDAIVEVASKVKDAMRLFWGSFTGQGADVDLNPQLMNSVASFGSGVREVFDTVSSVVVSVWPLIQDAFGKIFTAIGPLIPQLINLWMQVSPLKLAFDVLVPLLPIIADLLGQLVSAAAPLVEILASSLVPIVGSLAELFGALAPVVAGVAGVLVSAVAGLVAAIIPLLGEILPPLIELFSAIIPVIGSVVAAIVPVITTIAGLLVPVIQALMPVVQTVFQAIADVIGSVMQVIQGVIQVVTGVISGNWSQVWTGIQNIFGGIWSTIVNLVRGAINLVSSIISSVIGGIGSFIGGALGNIGRFFSDTWGGIVRGTQDMIGGLIGFFTSLPGKIMGVLSGAGQWLVGVGRNIVQGLLDGIGAMAGSIGRFFLNLLPDWIVGPFKAALGIASPSKVFRRYGVNIGEGLLLGMDDMEGLIQKRTQSLVSLPLAAPFTPTAPVHEGRSGAGITNNWILQGTPESLARDINQQQRYAMVGVA